MRLAALRSAIDHFRQNKNNINQAVEQAFLRIGRVQLQITSQAYLNMESSRERYKNLQEQREAFAESFRTMEIRFNAGAINSVDYMVYKSKMTGRIRIRQKAILILF